MIPDDIELVPGMLARQDEGLLYEVEDIRPSTEYYELNGYLSGLAVVNYVQLESGKFPAGTKWNKDEAGFRKYFTLERPQGLITLEDFGMYWNKPGAQVSWRKVVEIATKNEDFPLQRLADHREELTGDVAAAIDWLKPKLSSQTRPPVYYVILERIVASRTSE